MTEQRKMSLEEAKALWESIRAGGWVFVSYYKYSFTYQSKVNPKVTINLGGDRDNIYRENFTAEMDFSKDELSDVQWLYNAVDDSYYSQPETW